MPTEGEVRGRTSTSRSPGRPLRHPRRRGQAGVGPLLRRGPPGRHGDGRPHDGEISTTASAAPPSCREMATGIKSREQEADDLQLIDGVSDFSEITTPTRRPFLSRIDGASGAVDITLTMLRDAVEAIVEVDISQLHQSGLSLLISSFVSDHKQDIQLFHGIVSQPCELRRCVIAVVRDTCMHLKFKFSGEDLTNEVERCASFKAKRHGSSSQQIELDEASITVKVTWSTF
ncbi:hypothetical protein ACP4OV_014899 [Aristida adscensionis]